VELEKMGVNITIDNWQVERECDIVILAVKPQNMDNVLAELQGFSDKVYISIAAGITLEKLTASLGANKKIVRTMPNTPLMVGCGITILCGNGNLSDDELKVAEEIFMCAGEVVRLDESLINPAMALSASSPAYVYMLIEAMAASGVKRGLPPDIAVKLAAAAVEGSGKMVRVTGETPSQLKDNVCSPGGTTIEAVRALEKNNFAATIDSAVDACVKRGNELDSL
jgi:pyrroline-5-carboxylate reductase